MDTHRVNRSLFLLSQQRLILSACAVTLIGLDLILLILAADWLINHPCAMTLVSGDTF